MKAKLYSIILLLSLLCYPVFGQKNKVRDAEYYPRNELYIQYGTPTVLELATTLQSNISSNNGSGESKNYKFTGVGSLGYNFSITEKFAVGVYGGVSYASADLYVTKAPNYNITDPILLYRTGIVSYTGQVSATWTFFSSGAIECSSAAYLGVGFLDETITPYDTGSRVFNIPEAKDKWKVAYHLTAIKFRYGEMVGGFVELGFGYRGLVNIGMSVKL